MEWPRGSKETQVCHLVPAPAPPLAAGMAPGLVIFPPPDGCHLLNRDDITFCINGMVLEPKPREWHAANPQTQLSQLAPLPCFSWTWADSGIYMTFIETHSLHGICSTVVPASQPSASARSGESGVQGTSWASEPSSPVCWGRSLFLLYSPGHRQTAAHHLGCLNTG